MDDFITAQLRGAGSSKQETRQAENSIFYSRIPGAREFVEKLWVETSHVKANRGELLIFGDIIPI